MSSTPKATSEAKTRFASAADFQDLTNTETTVDYDRLRFLSFHGIPDDRDQNLRGRVWSLLIPDLAKRFEDAAPKVMDDVTPTTSVETAKWLRETLDKYQADERFFQKTTIRSRMEKICLQYQIEHPTGLASRDPRLLVHLFGPFIFCLRRGDCEGLFLTFMDMLERHNSFEVKEQSYRRFMSLFRSQLPRLCAHFDSEELDPRKWVMSWHQSLFARQLPLRSLLRLWDAYFSVREGNFELHTCVCLAVLKLFENDLLDKSYPELRAFMQVLPNLDIERIVTQGLNFQCLD